MSTAQRIAAGLGAVLAILGLLALFAPGLLTGIPANRGLVVMLGILLALGGFREIQRRRATSRKYAETPDAEEIVELPTPGDEFDDRFDRLSITRYRVTERKRLRDEVADIAEETLVRRFGLSPEEARLAMREGTWTDDAFAASVFTGSSPTAGPLERAREYLRPGPSFSHRVERTAAELARIVDEPQDPGNEVDLGVESGAEAASDQADDDSVSDADPAIASIFNPDSREGSDD